MFNTNATPTEMIKWLSERNHHIPKEELAFMLGIGLSEEGPSDPFEPFDFDDEDYEDFASGRHGAARHASEPV